MSEYNVERPRVDFLGHDRQMAMHRRDLTCDVGVHPKPLLPVCAPRAVECHDMLLNKAGKREIGLIGYGRAPCLDSVPALD